MDKIGPMCRSVTDCALVFNAIYGPDGEDLTVVDQPFSWNPVESLDGLRVGYVKQAFEGIQPSKGEDLAAFREREQAALKTLENDRAVLRVLEDLGMMLIPIELPEYDYESLFIVLVAEAAAAFDELTRYDLDDQMKWQDKDAWPNMFRAARLIPAVEYIQANRIRALIMRDMAAVMQQVDVFVSPAFLGNTLRITNLTGHPAVVLPNGFTEKGTPTSITFVGGLYNEAAALTLAHAYQQATTFHYQHPPMKFIE
jgi:Asp-tRNA(Asn)/Glu-tRNA(Gln) amidotransferase A subunit family amidase